MDLQTLQNHTLRICFNIRLLDRMSVKLMHNRANLVSLEHPETKTNVVFDVYFQRET